MLACGPERIPGIKHITGDTIDVTKFFNFAFYELFWFHDNPGNIPKLGWWLGVLYQVWSALFYYILKANGSIKSRKTIQHVPREEIIKATIVA